MNVVCAQSSSPAIGPVSKTWPPFAAALAAAIGRLTEDQFLVIAVKHSLRAVQFAGQGALGLRAEVIANAYLDPADRIDAAGLAQLRQLGWHDPSGSPAAATPQKDPDGSPNHFLQCPVPVDAARLADLAVRTLREVLGVPHVGFLEYEASRGRGKALSFPALGLRKARRQATAALTATPPDRLLAAMRRITGMAALAFDIDGDLCVGYGHIVVLVSLSADGSHTRIRATLAVDVKRSPKLLARLNEANASSQYLRLVSDRGTIVALAEVPVAPFVPEHLAAAYQEVCRVGDALSTLWCAEFGGRNIAEATQGDVVRH